MANYKGPSPTDAKRKSGQLTMIEEEEPEVHTNAKSLEAKKEDWVILQIRLIQNNLNI